jgi:hypothetical protein
VRFCDSLPLSACRTFYIKTGYAQIKSGQYGFLARQRVNSVAGRYRLAIKRSRPSSSRLYMALTWSTAARKARVVGFGTVRRTKESDGSAITMNRHRIKRASGTL